MKRNKIKSVFVTGGTGFIGSHVVDYLRSKNLQVYILARTKSKLWRDDLHFIWGDIRDKSLITEAVSKCDGVIHLAGRLGTSETINDPFPSVDINIVGSLNVFNAIKEYQIPAVYIAVGNHWMNNSYSITKTTAERLALMYNREHGTRIAVVRGLNAYGERQKHYPVKKIIPTFILHALQNKKIPVYGNGKQKMDMIYVGDLAIILSEVLLRHHTVYDRVIEGGTGKAPTVVSIAKRIVKYTESKAGIQHLPMRPGEPKNAIVIADIKEIHTIFPEGFKFTSLDKGLEKTVAWYKLNKNKFI